MDENNGKTRVRYSYEGFEEMDDAYANMNYSSGKYLESLRQFCQTGTGEAFGSRNIGLIFENFIYIRTIINLKSI